MAFNEHGPDQASEIITVTFPRMPYDLSGLPEGQMDRVIDDWKSLVDRLHVGRDERDRAYLHEDGRPVVAVWGVGFNDGRRYTLAECEKLVRFLKDDSRYGGYTVMLGVPTGWRTLDHDSLADKKLHEIILQADIVSPWAGTRHPNPWRGTPNLAGNVTFSGANSITKNTCRWFSQALAGTT